MDEDVGWVQVDADDGALGRAWSHAHDKMRKHVAVQIDALQVGARATALLRGREFVAVMRGIEEFGDHLCRVEERACGSPTARSFLKQVRGSVRVRIEEATNRALRPNTCVPPPPFPQLGRTERACAEPAATHVAASQSPRNAYDAVIAELTAAIQQ
ncbi:Uncharacterized protein PBTT_04825 [Plasmodiophora brassicae]